MPQAQQGNTVQIHYTGRLDDQTEFDSSRDREPLQFTLGEDQVIPGFERAVMGMEVGESKTVRIPADQAYGDRMEENLVTIPREHLPPDITPEVGMHLYVEPQDGGDRRPAVVADVTDESITIDANHPLAGHALNFEIELVSIVSSASNNGVNN